MKPAGGALAGTIAGGGDGGGGSGADGLRRVAAAGRRGDGAIVPRGHRVGARAAAVVGVFWRQEATMDEIAEGVSGSVHRSAVARMHALSAPSQRASPAASPPVYITCALLLCIAAAPALLAATVAEQRSSPTRVAGDDRPFLGLPPCRATRATLAPHAHT
jgi:hypothetical protein